MMHDVLIGKSIAEIKAFKRANPYYRKWLEVFPRSVNRLRGCPGIDSFLVLPGAEPAVDGYSEIWDSISILMRESRGEAQFWGWNHESRG